jgi:hypothetical protein
MCSAHFVDVEPRVLHRAVQTLERCLPKVESALGGLAQLDSR